RHGRDDSVVGRRYRPAGPCRHGSGAIAPRPWGRTSGGIWAGSGALANLILRQAQHEKDSSWGACRTMSQSGGRDGLALGLALAHALALELAAGRHDVAPA